ncbi:MAG TPA: ankyrin repeat domain-containing protein [Candidatus Elarobacter sp.]|nr:ankyrin repeat domain-containing protein [Candidatus Elarobacter sp.]
MRHLRLEAKDLVRAGGATSLGEAQLRIARRYGFPSWPKLKAHVESLDEVGALRAAIDANDLPRVQSLMSRHPALHRAPIGYGGSGPLTWVAECRVPWEAPSERRLAMAAWMIANGSDVHQNGDAPLMRAALVDDRIPMMELLVAHGADVNARYAGRFPIVFAPCETLNPRALAWLLAHGADPNPPGAEGTTLDYVIATYSRSSALAECIGILVRAGARTRYDEPAVLAILSDRTDVLASLLDERPSLLHERFEGLDFGSTAERRMTLRGGTLLHVAAEYGSTDAARLLLDRGADPNVRAAIVDGIGAQTPLFHAASQFYDYGVPVARLLIDRGADLGVHATVPGDYQSDELLMCTPLGYAMRFPRTHAFGTRAAVRLLRSHGAPE